MEYWVWWNLNCGLHNFMLEKLVKFGVKRQEFISTIHVDMPLSIKNFKVFSIKAAYVIRDMAKEPLKKLSVFFKDERYRKNSMINFKLFGGGNQVSYFFQLLYGKMLHLYELQKVSADFFFNKNGVFSFLVKNMLGVTQSYSLYKWPANLVVDIFLKSTLIYRQSIVFFSYLILLK